VQTGTLLRMVGRVEIDFVISAVRLVGWVGDVFYRSNLGNMALLRDHLNRGHPGRTPSRDDSAQEEDLVRLLPSYLSQNSAAQEA
jgi:Domain of unknown function (DUF4112)